MACEACLPAIVCKFVASPGENQAARGLLDTFRRRDYGLRDLHRSVWKLIMSSAISFGVDSVTVVLNQIEGLSIANSTSGI